MNKRVIAALVAVVLATVGVIMLVAYARNADERAYDDAKLVSVLRVTASVPAGTAAANIGDKVETVELPRSAIADGAIDDLSEVQGLSTTAKLEPGEQVLSARFAKEVAVVGSVRNSRVPKGMQEVTIPLDAARAVGGVLKAGDTVGVVSSVLVKGDDGVTQVIVNRAVITRISRAVIADGEVDATGAFLVTLAVKTRQVGEIINTAEYGKLWLTQQYPDTEGGSGGLVSKVQLGSGNK